MKVLIFTLVLVAGAFARSAVQQNQVQAEGPACPIDDPLEVDGPVPLNITLDPLLGFAVGSQIQNLIVEGLSTLHYEVDVNALLLTARFEVTAARASGNATYQVAGYLDARPFSQSTIPSGNLTGSGLGKVSSTGLHVKGSASLWINVIGNKVTVRTLNLEIVNFDSLEVDLGTDITIGGEVPNWAELNRGIKENFDREFAANKAEVTEKIRLAANNVVGQYTLAELIDLITNPPGGGGDC